MFLFVIGVNLPGKDYVRVPAMENMKTVNTLDLHRLGRSSYLGRKMLSIALSMARKHIMGAKLSLEQVHTSVVGLPVCNQRLRDQQKIIRDRNADIDSPEP